MYLNFSYISDVSTAVCDITLDTNFKVFMIITTRKRGNDNCQKIRYSFSHQSIIFFIRVIRVILFKLLFFIIFNLFFAFLVLILSLERRVVVLVI